MRQVLEILSKNFYPILNISMQLISPILIQCQFIKLQDLCDVRHYLPLTVVNNW